MIINLLRDIHHTDPDSSLVEFQGLTSQKTRTIEMGNDGLVYPVKGTAMAIGEDPVVSSGSTIRGAGLFITPPIVDDTPYRVQGSIQCQQCTPHFFVGTGPSAVTGVDLCTKVTFIPIGDDLMGNTSPSSGDFITFGRIDKVIMVPGIKESDPDYGKPIAFGFGVTGPNTGTSLIYFHLSVQNLSKTAPQFAASMS